MRQAQTSHEDTEKSSRSERQHPRRHQQLSAMTLQQLRETKCVKMRGKFLRLLDSDVSLTHSNINNLCLTPLTGEDATRFF